MCLRAVALRGLGLQETEGGFGGRNAQLITFLQRILTTFGHGRQVQNPYRFFIYFSTQVLHVMIYLFGIDPKEVTEPLCFRC